MLLSQKLLPAIHRARGEIAADRQAIFLTVFQWWALYWLL